MVLTISGIVTTSLEVLLLSQLGLSTGTDQTLTGAQLAGMLAVVIPSGLTALVLAFIVQILLTGLLTAVVGRSVLGDRITAGEAWRIALPRLPALLLATLLTGLALLGPWAGLAAVLILLGVAGAPGGLLIAIGFLGVIAAVVLDVWFWTMFSMSAAAVVLERQGPAQALGRSWRLVRKSFWRVFGILLLAGIIVLVASSVLRLPFTVISAAFSSGSAPLAEAIKPSVASLVIGAVGSIVAGAITQPISAGVTVLLYVDLRMRREGLDLALQTATSDAQAPADDFATVWRPTGPQGPGGAAGAAQTAPQPGPGPGGPARHHRRRAPRRRGDRGPGHRRGRPHRGRRRRPGHRPEGGAAARPRRAGQARVPPSRLAARGRDPGGAPLPRPDRERGQRCGARRVVGAGRPGRSRGDRDRPGC